MRLGSVMGILAAMGIIAALVLPVTAAAQERLSEPFAEVVIDPGPRVMVGQPVTVRVEVLVPTWFTKAPRWPDLEVPNALTLFDATSGSNFTRVLEQTWAGQARSYIIYPQRPGPYTIAEIPIDLHYSVDGSPRSVTVSPAPVRFEASLPPGAEGLPYFIATRRLDVEQTFDREPDTLRVGEAFIRPPSRSPCRVRTPWSSRRFRPTRSPASACIPIRRQ